MKLVYYTYRKISLLLFVLMAVWGVLFYYAIIDEVMDETDDTLENYSEILINNALMDPSVLETEGTLMSFYKFRPISEEEAEDYDEKYYDSTVYIESEGWLAHSIETLGADGVARSFHPNINIEKEVELIRSVIELGIPLHLIPSHLELRSSHIRWLSEEQLMDEFKEQVPASVYRYIQENIV